MNLRSRLSKLEKQIDIPGGDCPLCWDRRRQVAKGRAFVLIRRDTSIPEPSEPNLSPCPACGWQPAVVILPQKGSVTETASEEPYGPPEVLGLPPKQRYPQRTA
jgi:hypothetical protein